MHNSNWRRDVGIVAAAVYVLVAIAVVATGRPPVCRLADAGAALSAADRSSRNDDDVGAARLNLEAARFVLGCPTVSASVLGFHSLGRAGTAYVQSQYRYVLWALGEERSDLTAAGTFLTQMAPYANPYAALLRPSISAIARVTAAIAP